MLKFQENANLDFFDSLKSNMEYSRALVG